MESSPDGAGITQTLSTDTLQPLVGWRPPAPFPVGRLGNGIPILSPAVLPALSDAPGHERSLATTGDDAGRADEAGTRFPVPRLVHLTTKNRSIPRKWKPALLAWKRLHPDWQVVHWTDEDIRLFMQTYYAEYMPMFVAYRDPIQRVDAWRYFVLYHYGGVYCDMDHLPLRNIEPMFAGTACEAYFTAKHIGLVTNAFMASCPRARVWLTVFAELKRAATDPLLSMLNKHFRIMFTTGPWMLTRALGSYQDGVFGLLPPAFNPQHHDEMVANPYMRKLPGGSWHSWDSQLMEHLAPYTTLVLIVLFVCCLVGLCMIAYGLGRGLWWACRSSVAMVDHQLTPTLSPRVKEALETHDRNAAAAALNLDRRSRSVVRGGGSTPPDFRQRIEPRATAGADGRRTVRVPAAGGRTPRSL